MIPRQTATVQKELPPHFEEPKARPEKESKLRSKQKTLSVQIASDIHLEFYENRNDKIYSPARHTLEDLFSRFIQPCAPILALLGDIGYPGSKIYQSFLTWCGAQFEKVLVVLGNHEFYGNEYFKTLEQAQKDCTNAGKNVIFCNQTSLEINNHVILATTLWSHINDQAMEKIQIRLADYEQISIIDPETQKKRNLHPRDTVGFHKKDVAWISEKISNTKLPVIILSHHAPSMTCSEPDIPPTDVCSAAFCSSLDYLFDDPVLAWGFGHTHFPIDFTSGTCHLLSNPAGYPGHEFPNPYNRPYKKDCVLSE